MNIPISKDTQQYLWRRYSEARKAYMEVAPGFVVLNTRLIKLWLKHECPGWSNTQYDNFAKALEKRYKEWLEIPAYKVPMLRDFPFHP